MSHDFSAGVPARHRGSAVRTPRFGCALLLLALLAPGLAQAAPDWRRSAQEQLEPNNLVRPPGISVERCANIVRRETGGRVLTATPVERRGESGCEVRVLVDGKRVKSVFVDSSGRISGN